MHTINQAKNRKTVSRLAELHPTRSEVHQRPDKREQRHDQRSRKTSSEHRSVARHCGGRVQYFLEGLSAVTDDDDDDDCVMLKFDRMSKKMKIYRKFHATFVKHINHRSILYHWIYLRIQSKSIRIFKTMKWSKIAER